MTRSFWRLLSTITQRERNEIEAEREQVEKELQMFHMLNDAVQGWATPVSPQKFHFFADKGTIAELTKKHDELASGVKSKQRAIVEAMEFRTTLFREQGDYRRNMKQKILDETDVLCSTLSGSALEVFSQLFEGRGLDRKARFLE